MKKILLIIALTLCIFQMVVLAIAIDIGSPAIDRATSFTPNTTLIDKNNPANDTGTITSVKIYSAATLSNVEVATFFWISGSNYSTRDYETVTGVTAGQTTHTVNIDVQSGDFIGIYYSSGTGVDYGTSGGVAIYYSNGDHIPCTNHGFTNISSYVMSVYGTGTTAVAEDNVIFFGTDF